jgi:hypothetical protein
MLVWMNQQHNFLFHCATTSRVHTARLQQSAVPRPACVCGGGGIHQVGGNNTYSQVARLQAGRVVLVKGAGYTLQKGGREQVWGQGVPGDGIGWWWWTFPTVDYQQHTCGME